MYRYCIILCCTTMMLFAGPSKEEKERGIIVYAYDSFVSEWGLAPKISEQFTKETDITVNFVSRGDAIATFQAARNHAADDPARPDVIIGIDNNMASQALSSGMFRSYVSPSQPHILSRFLTGMEDKLIPYDFGYLSFVYQEGGILPPESLEDLTDTRFANSIVLSDPRSSSTGLAFLFWTIVEYGDGYLDYWKRLQPSIMTIVDSWSTAYGLFTAGEAAVVLSYTTSPVYHAEFEDNYDIKATSFPEGNYLQVEYVGITSYAEHPEDAALFVDFLLSPEVQAEIPLTNIMYPVRSDIPMPASFSYAQSPEFPVVLSYQQIQENQKQWLSDWQDQMSNR